MFGKFTKRADASTPIRHRSVKAWCACVHSVRVVTVLAILILASAKFALAHHSFVMFDGENPISIQGVVIEYKLTNPHAFVMLKVTNSNGSVTNWNLEGASAASLVREGWSNSSLKPGDEVIMKIAPLRSGAPGGAWETRDTKFPDGKPIVTR